MAETEEDVKRIENMIAVLESSLLMAGPGEKEALKNTVSDLRIRREEIQKKVKEREEQEMAQQRYNMEVSQAMQRETGLNSEEKGIFGNFLQKEFFTKADFGSLEQFYTKTYDRLTEQGKDQMDHRVWEGVRRNEYKFTDLPEPIKERISARIYQDITKGDNRASNIEQIPQQDKADFVSAYGSGDKKKAYEILDRDSFKKDIAVREQPKAQQASAGKGKESDGQAVQSFFTHTSMSTEEQGSSVKGKKSLMEKHLSAAGIENLTPASPSENKAAPKVASGSEAAQRTP